MRMMITSMKKSTVTTNPSVDGNGRVNEWLSSNLFLFLTHTHNSNPILFASNLTVLVLNSLAFAFKNNDFILDGLSAKTIKSFRPMYNHFKLKNSLWNQFRSSKELPMKSSWRDSRWFGIMKLYPNIFRRNHRQD